MLSQKTIVDLKNKVESERNLEFSKKEIKDIIYTVFSLGIIDERDVNDVDSIFGKVDFNLLRLEYDRKYDEADKYVEKKHKEYYGDEK